MKSFVIDASVTIKWIFPDRPEEDHVPQALNLLHAIKQNQIKILQPPHWLAETIAVVTRLQPSIAKEVIDLISAMEFPVIDAPEIYWLASQLSTQYSHHLFDTLYHAVALHHGDAELITADDQYYKKTHKQGAICRLAHFSLFN